MHRHFILDKPYGYLSQFTADPLKQKKKKVLGELGDFPEGTMAIGRLDEDSEGLLLLTTDSKVSELIRGKHIEKEYYAQVDGLITEEALQQLQKGIALSDGQKTYQTRPCRVFRLEMDPGFRSAAAASALIGTAPPVGCLSRSPSVSIGRCGK